MVSKIVLLALIVVSTANAAIFRAYLPEKPSELAHKEGCYIKEVNDVIPFGTTITPLGYCYRIQCSSSMIIYASCGVAVVSTDDSKCYITDEDLSKPYPSCCPNIKCDLDNKLF